MRQYRDSIKNGYTSMAASIGALARTMGGKLIWVFGSVAGLVVVAMSVASVGRTSAAEMINPTVTATPQQTMPTPSTPIAPSSQSTIDDVSLGTQSAGSDVNRTVPRASLRINGESVPLPTQGTIHKEIESNGGKTTIDMSIDTTSSGSSSSNSSSSIILQSTTESTNATSMDTESEP